MVKFICIYVKKIGFIITVFLVHPVAKQSFLYRYQHYHHVVQDTPSLNLSHQSHALNKILAQFLQKNFFEWGLWLPLKYESVKIWHHMLGDEHKKNICNYNGK